MPKPPLSAFTPRERRLIARLDSPEKVQAWLNGLPYNWERHGETARSFRGVVQHGTAHCLEAALACATILEQHGWDPVILDIESTDRLDHVIYPFQRNGKWGAVARSRCIGLNGRKPAFRNLEALVRSYVAPFIDETGRVKGYGLLDLRRLPTPWRLGTRNQWSVQDALNDNRHHRLPTPERTYRLWKRRFDAWHEEAGRPAHAWPTHYPDRHLWMAPAPLQRRT